MECENCIYIDTIEGRIRCNVCNRCNELEKKIIHNNREETTTTLMSPELKIKQEPEDEFLESLKKEHSLLSKKLLALNKIIDVYEKNK